MSNIDRRLRGLEERLENEMRIHNEGGIHNQGGLGAPRPPSSRRPRPAPFSGRDMAFLPRTPQATETEHRMREVHKVSGKLNVNGEEYRSRVEDLQQLGELGSGTCGHVVKMLHKPSSTVIAVKQMRRSGNSEETKRILMDLDVVVRSHGCPYIVRCLGCFVTDADVWICMELMASCFDKLLKRLGTPIPEAILGKVTVATVKALSYLKNVHGVIHRDVKPSNILLDECGNVKLCDFGISGRLVDSKAKTRSAGCAAYMAPERIDPPDPTRPDYDIRADVWSLGISLVELATGVFPYRDCQNDFEVLTKVIADDPPQLPEDSNFSPEFKLFVSQCLTKNYKDRPKYAKLLEHPFVVNASRSNVSVESWYASLPIPGQASGTAGRVPEVSSRSHEVQGRAHEVMGRSYEVPSRGPEVTRGHEVTSQGPEVPSRGHEVPNRCLEVPSRCPDVPSRCPEVPSRCPEVPSRCPEVPSRCPEVPSRCPEVPSRCPEVPSRCPEVPAPRRASAVTNGEAPVTPQPVRNFVTSAHHWTPEMATPTPSRPWWAAGGSSSQPASLEADLSSHSPYPRRRTFDTCASPPPTARRVSADSRWRPSPQSSGNTSPIVLQRFYHQSQQRRSRVDLHATPRHRSLSREHSTGRSPEPPPRTSRQHQMLGHEANGSMELEPPALHERLHPASPLLRNNDKLSEGRSHSLTRAELRNGYREPAPPPKLHHDDQGWLHSLAGLVKRRLSGYVKWHHVAARREPHHQQHLHHRWGNSESWSMPASPLPPRVPPSRPAD